MKILHLKQPLCSGKPKDSSTNTQSEWDQQVITKVQNYSGQFHAQKQKIAQLLSKTQLIES
jgi:hypothetical protein